MPLYHPTHTARKSDFFSTLLEHICGYEASLLPHNIKF
jgi:hypothetical protein